MANQGYQFVGGNPYIYQASDGGASSSIGWNNTSQLFEICTLTAAGASPSSTPQFKIDPSTNGNITISPKGSGSVVISTLGIGAVLSSASGVLSSTGAGTNGYVLTSNGPGNAPTFQAASGGGIGTLNADSGSAMGATVTIAGTTHQIATSASGSMLTISIPSSPTLPGTVTCSTGLTVTSGSTTLSAFNASGMVTNNSSGVLASSATTNYALQLGNSSGTLSSLTLGSSGQILTSGGSSANPAWTTATYPLTVATGDILAATGTNTIGIIAGTGATAGYVLTGNGSGVAPTWDLNVAATSTGFVSWGGSGNYFTDTTLGSFTVLRPGTGYIQGKAVSWTAPQTVTGLVQGTTSYIYIDATGTIGFTSSYNEAETENYISLFECLYDSTPSTAHQLTVKENHPYDFPYATAYYLHTNVGTLIENMQGGANIALNSTASIQINGADTLSDHGLYTTIPDSDGAAVTWLIYYTTAGGKWARYTSSSTFTGVYNNAGTPTALTGTQRGVYTLYVCKDNLTSSAPIYIAVMDTSHYASLSAATTAISNGTTASISAELQQLECCQLGYIVYQENTSSITDVIISKKTLQSSTSTGGSNQAALILTNTSTFNGILSATDSNVQQALQDIDQWGKSTTLHGVLLGEGTGNAISSTTAGTAGQVLTSGGSSADPLWTTAVYPTTVATGDILAATGTNTIGVIAGTGATSGYVLTGNGSGNAASWKPISQISWTQQATSTTMAINTGYIVTDGSLCTLTLPATAAVGSFLFIAGTNAAGWKIAQAAGQIIYFGTVNTTSGTSGYLASSSTYDTVQLLCITANTTWMVISSIGNITYN